MNLLFSVNNQTIECVSRSKIAAESLKYLKCIFVFTGDWDGFAKTAYFKNGGSTYKQILTDDECYVPSEVIKNGTIQVSVSGVSDGVRITTNIAAINVVASGFTSSSVNTEDITPTDKEQMENKIEAIGTSVQNATALATEAMTNATDAKNTANNANDTANSANATATDAKNTVDEFTDTFQSEVDDVKSNLDTKVDKEDGKGLSSNDYTDEAKAAVEKAESTDNKVTSLTSSSTNTQYLSAKSVYDALATKADKATTLAGYGIEDAYTKDETNELISAIDTGGTGDVGDLAEAINELEDELNGKADVADIDTLQEALDNKVGFTDYPVMVLENGVLVDKSGVVRVSKTNLSKYGISVDSNGYIGIEGASQSMIDGGTGNMPVTSSLFNSAVRKVKPTFYEGGGLSSSIDKNTIYTLRFPTSVDITLPSGEYGDWIQFDFYSGETPTSLTINSSSGITDHDLIPEANTAYSLYFDWGLINATDRGWRFSYAAYPYNTEV